MQGVPSLPVLERVLPGALYRCGPHLQRPLDFISEQVVDVLGVEAEEVLREAQDWDAYVWPTDRGRLHAALADALDHQRRFRLEYRVVTADGSLRWVQDEGYGVYDEDGHLLCIDGYVQRYQRPLFAEGILYLREHQLQGVLENLAEGLVVADLHGNLLHWNRAALQMHGFTSLEDVQRALPTFTEVYELKTLDGEVLTYDQWPMPRLFRGETFQDFHVRIHRLGTDWERIFTYGGGLVRDDQGTSLAFLTIVDSTEWIESQQALQAERDRFEQIVATVPGVIHTLHMSADGRIRFPFAAPGIRDIYGYEAEELREDASFIRTLYDPADSPHLDASIGHALATGTMWRDEFRIYHPTRGLRWIEGRSIPKPQPDGSVVWFGVLQDVTDRVESRQQLQAERDRFARIVATVPGVVHTYCQHPNGGISFPYASPGIVDIYGVDPEDLVEDASVVATRWHPEDVGHLIQTIRASEESETMWHDEFRVLHPTKGERWIEGYSIPQKEPDGTVLWFGVLMDVTDRKLAEAEVLALNADLERRVEARTEALKAANEELEAFAYSVSHDLRSPLRAIDGYTRILQEDYGSVIDAEGRRVCGIVRSEAQRMGQLIDDLLLFSRLGRATVAPARVSMQDLVASVVDALAPEYPHVREIVDVQPLAPAYADPAMLRQVWHNLLANALKFSSKAAQPRIEVWCERQPGEVVYRVRDNGAGFDMTYVNKLFGVFQRLHSERAFPGTGVGLAIVQRIVQRHQGRVWGEGVVEQGATFSFTLPERTP